PRTYIATAQAWDDEMRRKISDHQIQRGPDWTTIEAPMDIGPALQVDADQIVLLDCATLWLTNQIMANADIQAATNDFLAQLSTCLAPVVVVSNEVGQGITPDNAMARTFVKHQGRLNQAMAVQADHVVFVTAGIPQVLK
ncbi:MAG: bifunctional adenosylcobinamide kinase/adenosylcobinamide-phosphate guanylyltransferase, partial [Planktomarina sp.]